MDSISQVREPTKHDSGRIVSGICDLSESRLNCLERASG